MVKLSHSATFLCIGRISVAAFSADFSTKIPDHGPSLYKIWRSDGNSLRTRDVTSHLALQGPRQALTKRELDGIDVCFEMTVNDPLNQHFLPGHGTTWWDAPEYYTWLNSSCIKSGYSREFRVWCRKIRSRGMHVDGEERQDFAECDPGKVCINDFDSVNLLDPSEPGAQDVECVARPLIQLERIQKATQSKKWCSRKRVLEPAGLHKAAEYKVTLETSRGSGQIEVADLWFEVIADWWRYGHKFAERVGPVTSGYIRTSPALGKTYVRFCAHLAAETTSRVLPWVAMIYTTALVHPRRRGTIGGITSRTPLIDVEHNES